MTGQHWRRALRCESNSCVEVAPRWHKSTRSSESANCVEVAELPVPDQVWVRDSKAGEAGPVLRFPAAAWASFVAGVAAGDFDRP